MREDFFYSQVEKNTSNQHLLDEIKKYAEMKNKQIYVLKTPLSDKKYTYSYEDALVLLIPKNKIIFINYGINENDFDEYISDFIEDLGSISDKYEFRNLIGRPREWKKEIVHKIKYDEHFSIDNLINITTLSDEVFKRNCELLISLLTGSINDVNKFDSNIPNNLLDKIKQNIILFDGKQTRFIYEKKDKKVTVIQGLSGTGKTELLLHKLKDIFISNKDSKIMFTCHSKVLANNLYQRIPEFFNFMKVEEQIKWNDRLWCVSSWGTRLNKHSGAYRYICDFYDIDFLTFGNISDFDKVTEIALKEIKEQKLVDEKGFVFDYMLIDESQDFGENFISLCAEITKEEVYVAGDIFQSIFDKNIKDSITPDYLLSKCYRTDPKTLMFAHGLGMALFEEEKLRWLSDDDLISCGYILTKIDNPKKFILEREPLRRFEDVESIKSIELIKYKNDMKILTKNIITILEELKTSYPTILPSDIAIMFPNTDKTLYTLSDILEKEIKSNFDWDVNKSYESKEKLKNKVFISNRNNVKGLEFPFVICITTKLHKTFSFRNALYMMLTRSFIKSYLLTIESENKDVIDSIENSLNEIVSTGKMSLIEPTEDEKRKMMDLIIEYNERNRNQIDIIYEIFNKLSIPDSYREKIQKVISIQFPNELDEIKLKKAIESNFDLVTIMES
ncbi:ATP-binding domain-containing protein [Aliarcobacter butzleri]|uniref:ATP-binding domain-containing protein n=1 Tax=Aliarcobacter butzleri TaxID=28197 RepID=A0AAW6VLZ6_9BACT|nr:ATP-binding domain-containing protein [Aliarcobacter butzleri]MCG3702003.1 ATP-binding domain-containing protein [Aliarcobacter butzleri]MDH1976091.1 ATP-binding domain-containing protein [Aliarcobacter butzleri]MDK2061649.1 ATP-binding domain-containing protein [Aliarcobacter butzleri]MDK2069084.1 ATP-binding domain-containing protein [Aliarcobacter butzleri]MDN5077397.1 ATP-binding domain-containing protein [Aliarcobacter butzleri]